MLVSAWDLDVFASSEKRETDGPKIRVPPQYCAETRPDLRIHGRAVAVVIRMDHTPYLDAYFCIYRTSAIAALEGAPMRMLTVRVSD